MKKTCTKCGLKRAIVSFGVNESGKDGLHSHCKLCRKIYDKSREHAVSRRFSAYKKRAKKKAWTFVINKEEFKTITSKTCEYCGCYSVSNTSKFCGIDRMNSNKGYTKTNIVPCCNVCNMMKGTLTYEEFTKHIVSIFQKLSTKE